MHQNNKTCLIIAQSGHALAASATAGGWAAHVLDRFADLDTLSVALSCQTVTGVGDGFHTDDLLGKLSAFHTIPLHGVIYGSGLEEQYEILEFLHRHWALLGNEVSVVRACKDPALFFPTLSKLGIPHPHNSLIVPQGHEEHEWLVKKIGASGGGHIRAMDAGIPADKSYFQHKLSGRSLSIVFLANSKNATIVGISEIWTVAPEINDYRYAGAITWPDLSVSITQTLENFVHVLVREIGLQGLCGMDVILDENGQCQVLEINPRPTATFELYQSEQSLCDAHIQACAGKLVPVHRQQDILKAYQIQYADVDLVIPDFTWPDWTCNRPPYSRRIRAGDPVCTVHAEAACMRDTLALLQNRAETLRQQIGLKKLAA